MQRRKLGHEFGTPLTPTTQLWINRPSISAVLDAPFYNNACDWSQARSSLFPHQTTAITCHLSCGVRARVYVYFLWNIDRYNQDIRKLYTKNNFIPSHCPAIVHIILWKYNTYAWLNNAKTNKYTNHSGKKEKSMFQFFLFWGVHQWKYFYTHVSL